MAIGTVAAIACAVVLGNAPNAAAEKVTAQRIDDAAIGNTLFETTNKGVRNKVFLTLSPTQLGVFRVSEMSSRRRAGRCRSSRAELKHGSVDDSQRISTGKSTEIKLFRDV